MKKKKLTVAQTLKWRERILNGKDKYYPKELIGIVAEMIKPSPVEIIEYRK